MAEHCDLNALLPRLRANDPTLTILKCVSPLTCLFFYFIFRPVIIFFLHRGTKQRFHHILVPTPPEHRPTVCKPPSSLSHHACARFYSHHVALHVAPVWAVLWHGNLSLESHVHIAVSISRVLAMWGWAGLWPVCPATPRCGQLGEFGPGCF